jgi:hypothetical protein
MKCVKDYVLLRKLNSMAGLISLPDDNMPAGADMLGVVDKCDDLGNASVTLPDESG